MLSSSLAHLAAALFLFSLVWVFLLIAFLKSKKPRTALLALLAALVSFAGSIQVTPFGPNIAIVGITDNNISAANTRLISNGGGLMVLTNTQSTGTTTQEIGTPTVPVVILSGPSGSIQLGTTDGSQGICFHQNSGWIGLSMFEGVKLIYNGATVLNGDGPCILDGSSQGWFEVGITHTGTGGTVSNAMTDISGFSGSYFLWDSWNGGIAAIARLIEPPCSSTVSITPSSIVRNSSTDATVNVATGTFSHPDATCVSSVPTTAYQMQVTLSGWTGDTTFNGTWNVSSHTTAGSFHIATVGTVSSPTGGTYVPKSHTGGNNNPVASVMVFIGNVLGMNHVAGAIPSIIATNCLSASATQMGDLWFFGDDVEGAGTGQYDDALISNGCGNSSIQNIVKIATHYEAVSDTNVNGLNVNGCTQCAIIGTTAASAGGTVINLANTTDNSGILIWGIHSNWTNHLVDNINSRTYAQGTTSPNYDHIGFYLLRSGIEGDLQIYGGNGGGGKNNSFERLTATCQGISAPDCDIYTEAGGSGTLRKIYLGNRTGLTAVGVKMNASVRWSIDSVAHEVYGGTAPSISSGFGTSPSVVAGGVDNWFTVNVGTGGTATSGVVNFALTWNATPHCIATDNSGTLAQQVSATTTQATLTSLTAWSASSLVTVECH